jgi:hypothetical protein
MRILTNILSHCNLFFILQSHSQTAWWYQNFLFDFVTKQQQTDNALPDWFFDMVRGHVESLRELVQEVDSHSKWPWLGLLQALQHLPADSEDMSNTMEERREILLRLIEADPDRQGRYRYLMSKLD